MGIGQANIDGRRAESRIAQRIRELIVEGVLVPGSRIPEAAVADRLGVSRTPVRNALPALASEGLLERVGKRGYAVRNFTDEDTSRATEIRGVLEGYAARELAQREDRGPIVAELRETLREGDAIFAKGYVLKDDEHAYAAMNKRFHELIAIGASNPLLADLIARVYAVPLVAPDIVTFKDIALERVYRVLLSGNLQHHTIVAAISAGQGDVAEVLMRGHSSPAQRSLGLEGNYTSEAD